MPVTTITVFKCGKCGHIEEIGGGTVTSISAPIKAVLPVVVAPPVNYSWLDGAQRSRNECGGTQARCNIKKSDDTNTVVMGWGCTNPECKAHPSKLVDAA